ncbi:hypothetical protein [Pedobacter hartonius]|uniref:Uncharacterized protein n=1 Tax=Pedobacter hartonius TaxID=425514 RepID=A0A1H4CX76_9SPHI|nr:hypothetical protein [Pedobacter hartonius]SEA65055.1 hypothetical protein SAMN05443550_104235 [Pedobacter hartonius]
MTLLMIMLLKVCAISISHFRPSTDPFAVEKNAEEGKDTKEEALDKNEKKLLTCEFSCTDHKHFLWISHLPLNAYSYKMKIGSHPLKTVPTPPPDRLV